MLQWIQTRKTFGQNRNAESSWLQFSGSEVLGSCSNKSLTNAKVEHLWDTVFLRLDAALEMQLQQLYAAHAHANNSDDHHQASTRAVHVVQLFSIADSRTERLHVTSNSHCCIARTYLIQLSLMSVGFPLK